MEIQEHVPLAPLTTLGIGGTARYFARLRSEQELAPLLEWAEQRALPVFVLGGGSNLLVADTGYPGLVLAMNCRGIRRLDGAVEAGAGEEWDAFVAQAVAAGDAGVECLSGIPGTVGGTPVQNVGAYGQEVAETIVAVRAWDRSRGAMVELDRAACQFAYRSSIFNRGPRDRYIVTAVRFALRPGAAPALRYAELQRCFATLAQPSLAAVRAEVLAIRRGKAMLIEVGQPESRSAGSFFKNPIVNNAIADEVGRRAGVEPPRFATAQGTKLAAAWLIEQAGFQRGYRPAMANGAAGPVGLSSRHALAIVNYGGATAADVVALKDRIQNAVAEKFGVRLEPEPVFVGFGA